MTSPRTQLTRRKLLGTAAAASGVLAMPAIVAAQGAPLRIGHLTPLSGPQGILGNAQKLGAEVGAALINAAGGIDGHPIELVFKDDKGSGDPAVAAARELNGEGIHLFIGGLFTATVLALRPVLAEQGSVLLTLGAIADSINHEYYSRNVFRLTDNGFIRYPAHARALLQRYPHVRKWGTVYPDAEYAHSNWRDFSAGLRDGAKAGGFEIEIFPPILTKVGSTDFKQQISQLMSLPVQGMFTSLSGAEDISFVGQARAFGFDEKIEVFADAGGDFFVPKAFGHRVPKRLSTTSHWFYGAHQDQALGRDFYKALVERTHDPYPVGFVEPPYAALLAYAAAIKLAGSTETEAVIKALEGLTYASAKGSRTIRAADHQVINQVDIVEFGPQDAEPGWKILDSVSFDGAQTIEPAAPGQKA